MKKHKGYTAAQEILLAAADLSGRAQTEFSEWDLTVAVWKRNPNKFGSRGYEDVYPDHKRVMIEIMARSKKDNPLRQGWLEKTRANHYRISPLGLSEVDRLRRAKGDVVSSERSPEDVYEGVVDYLSNRAFKDYSKDPAEPRTWLGASAFLGITRFDPLHLQDRLRTAENAVQQALDWMKASKLDRLTRGPSGGGITIRQVELEKLKEFLSVLQDRFRVQLAAIRTSRR
jgi:hypothetical protein